MHQAYDRDLQMADRKQSESKGYGNRLRENNINTSPCITISTY